MESDTTDMLFWLVFIGVIGLVLLYKWYSRRTDRVHVPERSYDREIKVRAMPDVIKRIPSDDREAIFAAFMFCAFNEKTEENSVNLNILYINGGHQFDWYLAAKRNITDKDAFVKFATSRGYEISSDSTEDNIVVKDGDLGALCIAVATEMYGLSLEDKIDVIENW